MSKTMMEQLCEDPEFEKDFERERAVMDVTELICKIMEDQGVSRRELAERLGTTTSSVTRTLNGDCNMTIRKVAEIFFALGMRMKVQAYEP